MHGAELCEVPWSLLSESIDNVTCKAKLIRDNSPPDATLFNGRGSTPAWPATKNSTVSNPFELGSLACKFTLNCPPASDKRCICLLIFPLKSLAATWRFLLSFFALIW